MRLLYLTGRETRAPCLFVSTRLVSLYIPVFSIFSLGFFPLSSGFHARSFPLTSLLVALVFRHGPVACPYLVISHINSALTMSRAHTRPRFVRSSCFSKCDSLHPPTRRLLRHVAREEESRTQREDSDKELGLFLRFPSCGMGITNLRKEVVCGRLY